MNNKAPVTFSPAELTAWVVPGTTVTDAARQAGILLVAPCGGRGICGACGVRVLEGSLEPADEEELRGLARAPEGVRLACRARVVGPVTVRPVVLSRSREPALPRAGEAQRVSLVAGVDLGTTSVAATLVDPATGRELVRAVVPNTQASFGADVLSRISAALDGHAEELRELAAQSVAAALEAAAESAGVATSGIERVVIAGNTAMAALLTGADTALLATYPFTAPDMGGRMPVDPNLASCLARDATVELLPPIASFVGADALAGTLSAGLVDSEEPVLLVDLGTNAEIVLARAGRLVVTSAAAGPAFEGGGISCGGPAAEGAVTRVAIAEDGSVTLETMGGSQPRWFSGSGLVSAVAALSACRHLDASGLLVEDGPLAERFSRDGEGVVRVQLGADESECLALTQLDVRALQLAKAAVRVGIEAVLREAGVTAEALSRIHVAGAFGSALDPRDLIALGVLPRGVADKTVHVGNAALDGAAAVALDPGLERLSRSVAHDARHVELASDPSFASDLMRATEFAPYSVG